MKTWKIYKHTLLVSEHAGWSYIGLTCQKNCNIRWHGGSGYKYCTAFWAAIQKHGWDNFSHEIIEDNIEEKIIGEKEREYIQKYNSYYDGYNSTLGGEGESSVDFSIIEDLFLKGLNCLQISEQTGHTTKTISHALKAHGYTIIQHQGGKDRGKFIIYNGKEYPSYSTLARELIQNEEIFKNKRVATVVTGISNSVKNKTSYFGYKFYQWCGLV